MIVLCPRAGVVATAPRRRECTGGSHSAPCGPAGSLRSGNPTPAARANLLRPPRMCNGRDALPRVRCPYAVFGRAGARPSRCNARRLGTTALPQMNQCLNAIVNRKFPSPRRRGRRRHGDKATHYHLHLLHFYMAIFHDGEGAVATGWTRSRASVASMPFSVERELDPPVAGRHGDKATNYQLPTTTYQPHIFAALRIFVRSFAIIALSTSG